MKFRHVLAMFLMTIVFAVGVHPAIADAATTATPSVELLKPTSSTHVRAGGAIDIEYGFKNVIARPYVTLNFRKVDGASQAMVLDITTDHLTVPSTWKAGTYRLETVVIQSINNAQGEHFRSHAYVGTDPNGKVVCRSFTRLKLALTDIRVMK